MRKRAILLFKKSQSSQITEYAPIAKALIFSQSHHRAVGLWWNDKLRRNVSDSRKPPKRASISSSTASSTNSNSESCDYELNFDDWDLFLQIID